MGFFYSIVFKNKKGEDVEIQFKNAGDYDPQCMEVGDSIETPDGIHFGHEGCFVVSGGKIIAAFDKEETHLFTKWGHAIPFPDLNEINPLVAAIKLLSKEQNPERSVARDDDSSNAAK